MTKVEIAKRITKFVVGSSVSFSVANVIRNNTTPTNALQNAEAVVGGVAMGMVAADVAEDFTDRKIDEIVSWWNDNVKKN